MKLPFGGLSSLCLTMLPSSCLQEADSFPGCASCLPQPACWLCCCVCCLRTLCCTSTPSTLSSEVVQVPGLERQHAGGHVPEVAALAGCPRAPAPSVLCGLRPWQHHQLLHQWHVRLPDCSRNLVGKNLTFLFHRSAFHDNAVSSLMVVVGTGAQSCLVSIGVAFAGAFSSETPIENLSGILKYIQADRDHIYLKTPRNLAVTSAGMNTF